MENLKKYCPKHNISLLSCELESCGKQSDSICKYCALNSKELLTHLAEHFEHIKDLSLEHAVSSDSFNKTLKSDEEYSDLNKIFLDIFEKAKIKIDTVYEQISNKRFVMTEQFRNSLLSKYENFTRELENLVSTLSTKLSSLSSLNTSFREEISKLKKELDAKLTLLSNPVEITRDLEELLNKAEKIIKKLRVEELLSDKFNLDVLGKLPLSTELTTGGNRIIATTRGSSYWTTKSEQILEGSFICKIRVVSINSSYASSHWNYAVGIIRASSNNESSYYNDSIILQSNGYIPDKFTGSGSTRQLFFNNWKANDVIFIKRDDNCLYFGLNDENSFQLAYSDIVGPYRIVLGFSTSVNSDIFELEELNKL